MKSTSRSVLVVAAVCCIAFVSTVAAGGRGREGSTSINGTQANVSTGRSSLGEPVFLTNSTSTNANQSGKLVKVSPAIEKPIPQTPTNRGGSDRGTRVIFTPPPTIVSPGNLGPAAPANPAANVLAEHPFQGSLLDVGLNSRPAPKISKPTPDAPVLLSTTSDFLPSGILPGPGPQGPPTLDRVSTASTLPMFKGAASSGSPGGG